MANWCVVLGVGGCATPGPRSPVEVTRAQMDALRVGDEAAAMGLLTPEARRRAPLLPAREVVPAPTGLVEVERSAVWEGARGIEVVRSVEGWKIRQGVLALFRADSAEAALTALARAIEVGDARRVAELMPTQVRRVVGEEAVARALQEKRDAWRSLAQALAAGKVEWASRDAERAEAVLSLGGAEHRLILVLETEGWKVFDVRPWSSYLPR